jgi:hypothetical protein
MGRDNLNILLRKQGCHFKKAGLGYNLSNQQKLYKNFFVSSRTSSSPFITCYYCGLKGHSETNCNARKIGVPHEKKVWVLKSTLEKLGDFSQRRLKLDTDFSPFGKYTDRSKDRRGIRVSSHKDYVRILKPQGFSLYGKSSFCVKERFIPINQNKSNKKQKEKQE